MARINALSVYPELAQETDYFCVSSYEPMVSAFGQRTIVATDDDDYQGDSYRLIADGDEPGQRYGVLIFGWGSCSGCDALQACASVQEVQELMDRLQDSVLWFAEKDDLRRYMMEHDWEGDWSWRREACREFRQKVAEFLDSDAV